MIYKCWQNALSNEDIIKVEAAYYIAAAVFYSLAKTDTII